MNRLEDLMQYCILDTSPESQFDDWAEIVATVCGTPVSLVTFMDDSRQWYKSHVGTSESEVPLNESVCQHLLLDTIDELVINNTAIDQRTRELPLIKAENGIRFYAGVPLTSAQGNVLGSVCTVDYQPRELSAQQIATLKLVSKKVMEELERRKEMFELTQIAEYKSLRLEQLTAMAPGFLFAIKSNGLGELEFEFLSEGIYRLVDEKSASLIRGNPNHLFRMMGVEKAKTFVQEIKEGFMNLKPIARDCQLEALPWLNLYLQVNFQRLNEGIVAFGNVQDVGDLIESRNMLEGILFDISHHLRRPVANMQSIIALIQEHPEMLSQEEIFEALHQSIHMLDEDLNKANLRYQAYKKSDNS